MHKNNHLPIGEECYLDLELEVLVKDEFKISLSRLQFRILFYLATKLNQCVKYEELINFTWGSDSFITKQQLYVYINRIRERIEDNPRKPKCLFSVRGGGYVLYPRRKENAK
ncbi:winged helix-turn-helix domain-containing protein [Neobacillus endophyticus]|uniref:winged helix-turn-helix domain-containing protein n=1 Tax=Neobacillus endophyticus TaxID=2738405 RepID=UPI0035E460FC